MSIIKKMTLSLGIITLFAACLENNMPDLEVYKRAYILQTNSASPRFTPRIAYYSNYELREAHVVKDEKELSIRWFGNRYFEGYNSGTVSNISEVNGTYKANISSGKKGGKEDEITFNFSDSHVLGQMKVNEFSYKNNYIVASWEEVENANYFGVMVEPTYIDEKGDRVYYRSPSHLKIFSDTISHLFNDNSMKIPLSSLIEYSLTLYDSIRISLVAAYVDYNNTRLVLTADQKHLQGGIDSFIEDKKEEEE